MIKLFVQYSYVIEAREQAQYNQNLFTGGKKYLIRIGSKSSLKNSLTSPDQENYYNFGCGGNVLPKSISSL